MSKLDYNTLSWDELVANAANAALITHVPFNMRNELASAVAKFNNSEYSYLVTNLGYCLFESAESEDQLNTN